MQTWELTCHPETPPVAVTGVSARMTPDDAWVRLRWRIDGGGNLVIPPFAGKGRADRLWETTCFELFLRVPGEAGYLEFNFSPSERWAAYAMSGYREGMSEYPLPREPDCTIRQGQSMTIFDAALPLSALPPRPWQLAMTAVIEEQGGRKSYWAMAHPAGAPDFHDPACFTGLVAAPGAA